MILRRNPKPEDNDPDPDELADSASAGGALADPADLASGDPDLGPIDTGPIDTTPLYGEVIDPGLAGPSFGEIIPSTVPAAPGEVIVIENRGDLPDQVCASCGETAPGDAKFCEACGTDLVVGATASTSSEPISVATEPCVSCGAAPSDIDDGWCGQCGTKQPSPRDHQEYDKGWVAAVSDRGKHHRVNEDATAIAVVDDAAILVVCDGVSSTERPEEASELAAALVAKQLALAVSAGADIATALTDVVALAHEQVSALDEGTDKEAPSCTIVAAVAERDEPSGDAGPENGQETITVNVAWLGDSRAYLVDASGAKLITTDHSWAEEQRALGQLDAEAIEADPRAHSITHWLGADSPDAQADLATATFTVDRAAGAQTAMLVVCSDGLWNYAEAPDEFAALFAEGATADDGNPIGTAQRLVQFANDSGGRDNISVALADFTLDPQFRPDLAQPDEDDDAENPSEAAADPALASSDTDDASDEAPNEDPILENPIPDDPNPDNPDNPDNSEKEADGG